MFLTTSFSYCSVRRADFLTILINSVLLILFKEANLVSNSLIGSLAFIIEGYIEEAMSLRTILKVCVLVILWCFFLFPTASKRVYLNFVVVLDNLKDLEEIL